MRDIFVIHPEDRPAYARYFAEREERVRRGDAEPFEIIEDDLGLRNFITCRRVDYNHSRYATVSQMVPREDIEHFRGDFVPFVRESLDFMSMQVRTMLDRS